jgi:DNA-binding transcriptional LysR family regulator
MGDVAEIARRGPRRRRSRRQGGGQRKRQATPGKAVEGGRHGVSPSRLPGSRPHSTRRGTFGKLLRAARRLHPLRRLGPERAKRVRGVPIESLDGKESVSLMPGECAARGRRASVDLRRLRQLDLNLLVSWHALAEELGVTRAAERLGVSQPAMSAALARLRAFFGDELLVRSGHVMRLTPRGSQLAEHTARLLARLEETFAAPGRFEASEARQTFRLTLGPDDAFLIAGPLLRRLAREAPGVELRIARFNARSPRALERGETDLQVMPAYRADPELPQKLLLRDRWCLVGCAQHHRRTQLRRRSDFEGLRWVDVVQDPESFARPAAIRLESFREFLSIVAVLPSRLEAALAVVGTPLVFACPDRLARRFEQSLRVRRIPLRLAVLPAEQRQLPAYDLVMQWHPMHAEDPAHLWLRSMLSELGSAL